MTAGSSPSVLVVGAGPTGLVLALSLARLGVPFRIISDARGPGEHSRAMVVHARTLEFYRQFGWAEDVIDGGVKIEHARLREGGEHGGREVLSVTFGDIGEGLSPYPFPLAYPQDDHERLLFAKLKSLGPEVEWGAKLVRFTQDGNGVRATVARDGAGEEVIEADFICGCDGAHSVVRRTLKLGFPGGDYPQRYFVADVRLAEGFRPDLVVNLGEKLFVLLLPVRSRGVQRLIGLVPPGLPERDDLTFEDIRGQVEALVGVRVTEVNWFSLYRTHHRVAEHFRGGRAFILGDAGHIHSPAGGQGMNTGIGDAINLGWKLAMVAQGRAPDALLDSYEEERIGFARRLVATTDRAFTLIVAQGLIGDLTRRVLIPFLLSVGTRFQFGRHAFFRTVSQTQIDYAGSALSEGKAGHVDGGERLPWVPSAHGGNFEPLRSLNWQVHVYGDDEKGFRVRLSELGLPLHVFAWSEAAEHAGLLREAAYLVRPDGYVALALATRDAAAIEAYARKRGLRFAAAA